MKKSKYLFALALGASTLTFAQVGIGTSTPTSPLDIETSTSTTYIDINNTATDGDPAINFQLGTTTFSMGVDDGDDDKFKIGTSTIGTDTRMTIDNAGNVGIGTTSPDYLFHLYGPNNSSLGPLLTIQTDADAYPQYQVVPYDHDNVSLYFDGYFDGAPRSSDAGSNFRIQKYTDRLRFQYESGIAAGSVVSWTEGIVLNTSGNVGIGTESPSTLLHITNDDATANAVEDMFTITKSTSGIPANGIGAGLIFEVEDGGDTEEQGRINVEMDDVTTTTEDATMTFDINQNGTMTEIMRLDGTSGNVGIGTVTPSEELEVNGDIKATSSLIISDEDGGIIIKEWPGNSAYAAIGTANMTTNEYCLLTNGTDTYINAGTGGGTYIRSNENSTTNQIYVSSSQASVAGNWLPASDDAFDLGTASKRWDDVYATNGTIQTSDRRLKTNIDSLKYGLAEVMQLTPVSFNWKSDSAQTRNKIGYIAQEVQKVIPEVVNIGEDENQTLGINYSEMVVVLTNAIKEQQAIIEAQKKEIETQKVELGAKDEELKAELDSKTSENAEASTTNASEIEALKAQVQQLLQLIQQQESASVVK